MLVFLTLHVALSILLSISVGAAASLLCACLVSVHISAPYHDMPRIQATKSSKSTTALCDAAANNAEWLR